MSQPSPAFPSPSLRLSKPERLLRRRDFLRVQGEGKKIISPHFLWFGSPSPVGLLRLGVTVSKRVGTAVVRNRVKRLLREAFRHHKALLPPTWDLVAIARPESATVELQQVQAELIQMARRLAALPAGRRP
jgi:ribonuclease P protein component